MRTGPRSSAIYHLPFAIYFSLAAAQAQAPLPPDPVTTGRFHAGPVQLNPRVEITSLGVDSNIFNEAGDPQQDFTVTVRPTLGAGFRFGRARVASNSWLDFVYFRDHPEERAVNKFGEVRGELRLNRLVPFVRAAGLLAKDRPNAEIDLRAERSLSDISAGLAVQVLSRTALTASVQRQVLSYDRGQIFLGRDLATQLNNTLDILEGGVRMSVTSLTTVSLTAASEQQRFEFSPDRDADSVRLAARFEFDPDAVIHGTALVGYRRFEPRSAALREYRGLVTQVAIGWKYQDRTSVDVRLSRDVDYSVEQDQPYYLVAAASVIVRQRIGGPFDVQATIGRDSLHYHTRLSPGVPEQGAVDTTDTAGGGLGCWLGGTVRAGFNYEYTSRDARDGRSYVRRRVFGSLAYGF